MSAPVIFCDIDGVLIRLDMEYRIDRFTQECVDALAALIERTGAEVVLSSSWRYGTSPESFAGLLSAQGCTANVVGHTPLSEQRESGLYVGCTRGQEISAWLLENGGRQFVILDDEEDMGQLRPWLVRTDYRYGLTMADVERALDVLGAVEGFVNA